MISQINMAGLIFAVVFSIGCGLVPFLVLWKRSAAIETGMLWALCYGALGYFWAQVLLRYSLMAVVGNLKVFVTMQKEFYLGYLFVATLISAGMAVLANVWALYLTNQKQKSFYRSAAVGIGYGVGGAAIFTMMPLYSAIQINSGSFAGNDALKQSIANSNTVDLFLGGYKYGALVIIGMAISLIMGKMMNEGKIQKPIYFGLIVYGLIYFIRGGFSKILPSVAYRIVDPITLTLFGAAAIYVVKNWKEWNVPQEMNKINKNMK